jgi:hypothetical protein
MFEEPNLDNAVITSDSQFLALMNRQGRRDGRVKRLLKSIRKHSDYFKIFVTLHNTTYAQRAYTKNILRMLYEL